MDRIRDEFLKFYRNYPRFAYYHLDPDVIGFIDGIARALNEMGRRPRGLNDNATRIVDMVRNALEEYLENIDFPMGVKRHDTDYEREDHKSIIEFQSDVLAGRLSTIYDRYFHYGADFPNHDDNFYRSLVVILTTGKMLDGSYTLPRSDLHYSMPSLWNGKKRTGVDIDLDLDDLYYNGPDFAYRSSILPYIDDPPEESQPPAKKPRGSGKIKRRSSRRRKTKK